LYPDRERKGKEGKTNGCRHCTTQTFPQFLEKKKKKKKRKGEKYQSEVLGRKKGKKNKGGKEEPLIASSKFFYKKGRAPQNKKKKKTKEEGREGGKNIAESIFSIKKKKNWFQEKGNWNEIMRIGGGREEKKGKGGKGGGSSFFLHVCLKGERARGGKKHNEERQGKGKKKLTFSLIPFLYSPYDGFTKKTEGGGGPGGKYM